MVPRLLVFDLDGTLIDSRIDLSNSINAMLAHLGKPQLPDAVIASYIGDGVTMLVRRALGDPEGDVHDQEFVDAALTYFLDYYRIHKLDFTYVYDGVFEALEAIRMAHPEVPMAVLTNKPVRPSRDICAHFGLDRFFFQNYGGNSFHTKKPDPTGLLALIAEASELVPGGAPVTARNCGARAIGCTFGLAPHSLAAAQPDALSHSPVDWPQVLASLAYPVRSR
jgi:phosphoglycolate phosphatase